MENCHPVGKKLTQLHNLVLIITWSWITEEEGKMSIPEENNFGATKFLNKYIITFSACMAAFNFYMNLNNALSQTSFCKLDFISHQQLKLRTILIQNQGLVFLSAFIVRVITPLVGGDDVQSRKKYSQISAMT